MVRDLLFGLSFSFLPASFLSRSKFRTKMCIHVSQITSNEPIRSVVVTDLVVFYLKKSFQLFGSVVRIRVSILAHRTSVFLKGQSEEHKRDKAKTFLSDACQPEDIP